MLYFLCFIAGVFTVFYQVGYLIINFDSPYLRALSIFATVVLDLLSVVLAAIFMPAIVTYMFTFAFTRIVMYGISNIDNILYSMSSDYD